MLGYKVVRQVNDGWCSASVPNVCAVSYPMEGLAEPKIGRLFAFLRREDARLFALKEGAYVFRAELWSPVLTIVYGLNDCLGNVKGDDRLREFWRSPADYPEKNKALTMRLPEGTVCCAGVTLLADPISLMERDVTLEVRKVPAAIGERKEERN